jgi:hypothetical protein
MDFDQAKTAPIFGEPDSARKERTLCVLLLETRSASVVFGWSKFGVSDNRALGIMKQK